MVDSDSGPVRRQVRNALRSAPVRAFSERSFAALVGEHPEWGERPKRLLGELVKSEVLQEMPLRSEHGYRPKRRFVLSDTTPFEVAVSMQKGAFICHGSAAFLHGLTDEIPQTYYVNVEQSPKPAPEGELRQESIDRAFRNQQRQSRYVFLHGTQRFVQLSGKNSGRYGVTEVALEPQRGAASHTVPGTNLERTLIDLVVRPQYGGGARQVVTAFQLARERTTVAKLLACLRALDYRYPYHQALGFYMERAGFAEEHIRRLRELPMEVNFYLTYGMQSPDYSSTWRLYHPRTL